MKNHKSSAPVFNNKGKRYTPSFTEEVVKSILGGRFSSIDSARRFYSIGAGYTKTK